MVDPYQAALSALNAQRSETEEWRRAYQKLYEDANIAHRRSEQLARENRQMARENLWLASDLRVLAIISVGLIACMAVMMLYALLVAG